MNGRVYDYNVGRFLSVDPFIQGNGNSQGVNPYTYILNNPLGGTDPTGYIVCGEANGLPGCKKPPSRLGGEGGIEKPWDKHQFGSNGNNNEIEVTKVNNSSELKSEDIGN